MGHQELADRFFAAWNCGAVADILRLMSDDATYHDAFWGETCSGHDLVRYLDTELTGGKRWYEQEGDLIVSPTGVIVRYSAYDRRNPAKRKPLYKGAEVMTLADGLITGISDFYCHPDPVQLLEIATRIENRRQESKIALLGLSSKNSGFIKRRLSELGENTTVFLKTDLSARHLADRVGCTVSHLLHVLEEEKETTFRRFVNDWRVNFAATLLAEAADNAINFGQIARQSGFAQMDEFEQAFQAVFGMSATAYSRQSIQPEDCQQSGEPANIG